jgi:hypothetical protein
MNILITLSWVLWAIAIYQRRTNSPLYQAKWQLDFCRRQRQKAGIPRKGD